MNRKKLIAGVAIIAIVLAVYALALPSRRIQNQATVTARNLEVYGDETLTVPLTYIDWGYIEPGETVNRTVWIVNEGNQELSLNMSTESWIPENCPDYILCYWTVEGSLLSPDGILETNIYLEVFSNITVIESFSYDIIINGESV